MVLLLIMAVLWAFPLSQLSIGSQNLQSTSHTSLTWECVFMQISIRVWFFEVCLLSLCSDNFLNYRYSTYLDTWHSPKSAGGSSISDAYQVYRGNIDNRLSHNHSTSSCVFHRQWANLFCHPNGICSKFQELRWLFGVGGGCHTRMKFYLKQNLCISLHFSDLPASAYLKSMDDHVLEVRFSPQSPPPHQMQPHFHYC